VLEIRSDYFYPRKVVRVDARLLLPYMVWDCLLGNNLFDGTVINDVIGTTDGSAAADASCAEAETSHLCATETDDSNLDARRDDDGSTSAQRQVAPSEVISREPRGQVTYLNRSISSDSSLQCDSARPHGQGSVTGLSDRETAATPDSDVTPPQGEIEKCQTQITSADCNAVMSTRSHDTDRSDMNSLKSPTLLTSSKQPLAQLSDSESDDVHTEHINLQRACHQTHCDSEFRRLANICTSDTDAEYNPDNLSDTGQLFKKAQKITRRSNIGVILQN